MNFQVLHSVVVVENFGINIFNSPSHYSQKCFDILVDTYDAQLFGLDLYAPVLYEQPSSWKLHIASAAARFHH